VRALLLLVTTTLRGKAPDRNRQRSLRWGSNRRNTAAVQSSCSSPAKAGPSGPR
jgi:hypothetical protein